MPTQLKTLLPAIILGLIVVAGIVWYLVKTPAPVEPSPTGTTPLSSEPAKIHDEAKYYSVDATYPTSTGLAVGDQAAVATMKAYVEAQIALFKQEGNFANLTYDDIQMLGLDQRKYAIGIEYKTHESQSTLSYVYQLYQDTGGAHPNTFYQTFTFDKKTGALLTLKDVFVPNAKYLETLSTKSRATLPGMIAKMENVGTAEVDTSYIQSGTKPEVEAFQSFYFEGDKLVIVFPPYQVGPYVLGMIELPIPTNELADLKPAYKN